MAFDIKDAETAAAVAKIVEDELEKAGHAGVADLKKKNYELTEKLKIAKRGQEIDPAEFQSLNEKLEAMEVKLTEALKVAKEATKQAEKDRKALEKEAGFVSHLLVDNGLSEALLKSGIKPEMTKAVKAMLASQVTLKADGDKRIAVVGDKLLSDFVSEWSKSDEGKVFVSAPDNRGGGAPGGGDGKGEQKTMARTAFDALSDVRKMEFMKSGGVLTT